MTGVDLPDPIGIKLPDPTAPDLDRRRLIPVQEPDEPPSLQSLVRGRLERERQEFESQLAASLSVAVQANPDLVGEAQRLAGKSGLDPMLVERNIERVRQMVGRGELEGMASGSVLVRMMADPRFSRVAHDDTDTLGPLEAIFPSAERGQLVAQRGPLGILAQREAWGQLTMTEAQRRQVADITARMDELGDPRQRIAVINEVNAAFEEQGFEWLRQTGRLPLQMQLFPKAFEFVVGAPAATGELLGQMSQTVPSSLAMAAATGTTAGGAAMLAGPGAPVSVLAATGAGFAAGFWAEQGRQIYEIEAGNAFLDMQEQGLDPVRSANAAMWHGIVSTFFEIGGQAIATAPVRKAVTKSMSRELALGIARPTRAGAAKQAAKEWAQTVAGETGTELGQEVSNIVAELSAGGDPEDIGARLAEVGIKTLQGMAILGLPGPAIHLRADVTRARQAERAQGFFDDLTDGSTKSKTRERSPNVFERFVRAALQGKAAQDVRVQGETFAEALQQAEFTPEQRERLPEMQREARAAIETGGEVVIPIAEYAAHHAGTNLGDLLQQDVRIIPEGGNPDVVMSMNEAEMFQQNLGPFTEEAAKVLEQKLEDDATFVESARKVHDSMLTQLLATGQMSARDARASARLHQAFVVTGAEALSKTEGRQVSPEQFEKDHPHRVISGAEPQRLRPQFEQAEFFSGLQSGLEGIPTKTAAAPSWKAALTGLVKKGQVKREELEWVGLNDWLELQEGKVSKEEVLAFLQGNGVLVETVQLGEDITAFAEHQNLLDIVNNAGFSVAPGDEFEFAPITDRETGDEVELEALPERVREAVLELRTAEEAAPAISGRAKFGQYTLPGGENYREVLITLPVEGLEAAADLASEISQWEDIEREASRAINEELSALMPDLEAAGIDQTTRANVPWWGLSLVETPADDPSVASHRRHAEERIAEKGLEPFVERMRAVGLIHKRLGEASDRVKTLRERQKQGTQGQFRGAHFDEPNVVAHIRMDDRTDTEGNKVLFVQEVQSDWAQKGRAQGFAPVLTAEEQTQVEDIRRRADVSTDPGQFTDAERQLLDRANNLQGGIIRAPFVETTKGWLNLALKQTLLEAVNGDYDSVAFISGEQAADLYDLSRQVDSIEVDSEGSLEGKPVVSIELGGDRVPSSIDFQVDENGIVGDSSDGTLEGKPLEDVVGKEVAEKILAIEGKGSLTGVDLQVGGEGMRAFYDRMVPQALSKLSKKLGGEKVGTVQIDTIPGGAQEMGDVLDREADPGFRMSAQRALDITDKLRSNIEEQGLPLFQEGEGGPRGGFDPVSLTTILYERADLSTFLHESAHYFLTVYADIAASKNAPAEIVESMQTLLDWFGIESIEAWHSLSLEQQREHHEAFAANFELYLFKGDAPSAKLETLFERFRRFLMRFYGDVRGVLNANHRRLFGKDLPILTGEVRTVMDRMLASEREVEQAYAVRSMAPIFESQEAAGASDADWATYQKMHERRREAAVTNLSRAALRALQWTEAELETQGRVLKEFRARHAEARRRTRAEVAAEIDQQPVYRAERFLRRGELVDADGNVTEVEGAHKLDKAAVRELAPDADLRRLSGLMAAEGLLPDQAAELTGFDSGDALIQGLLAAPTKKQAIRDETDRRMLEEHADLTNPEEVQDALERALHDEVHTRFVALELKFLAKATQPVRLMNAAARQAARRALGGMAVRDIRPGDFSIGERRAAREADLASRSGKPEEAIAAKRRQLLQHYMVKEARLARTEIDKARKDWRKFFQRDKKLADSRWIDPILAGRALLADILFAEKSEGQQADLEAAALETLETDFPSLHDRLVSLQKSVRGTDHRALTLGEFREVREITRELWDLSRSARIVEIEGRRMELAAVTGELTEQIEKLPARFAPGAKPKGKETPTPGRRRVMKGWGWFASLKRLQHWVYAMDEGKRGPFTRFLLLPMLRKLDAYRAKKEQVIRDTLMPALEAIAKSSGAAWDARIVAPELFDVRADEDPFVFKGKKELLGAFLHGGTTSSLQKHLVSRGWALDPSRTDDVLDTSRWDAFLARMFKKGLLTKEDMDFVELVWQQYKDLLPMAQETHKKLYGYNFETLELREVWTPWGTLEGGYTPARVDPDEVSEPRPPSILQSMEALEEDFRYSVGTGKGFTITRNPNYNQPLNLDIGRHMSSLDQEMRFIYLQPQVKQVLRIVRDGDFKRALNNYDRAAINHIILPWLNNSARQMTTRPTDHPFMDSIFTWLRATAGLAALGFNVFTAAIQATGFANSLTHVKGKYMLSAVLRVARHMPQMVREAMEKSIRLRNRLNLSARRAEQKVARWAAAPSQRKIRTIQDEGNNLAFLPLRMVQGVVDVVTWHAAYEQSIAEAPVDGSLTEEQLEVRAVEDADLALERTQGAGGAESVAEFEVGTPGAKLFTQFLSFSNMQLNQLVGGPRSQRLRNAALVLLMVPLLEGVMRAALKFNLEPEDEDEWIPRVAGIWAQSMVRNAAGMVPIIGPAVLSIAELEGDRVASVPAIGVARSAVQGLASIVEGEEPSGYDARNIGTLMTVITGLPFMPAAKTIGYQLDVESGRVDPTSDIDYVRGLLTGTASRASR